MTRANRTPRDATGALTGRGARPDDRHHTIPEVSMSTVTADEFVEHTTKAALEEKAKLKKHFGRFDMFFFLICTLVGLDTLGAVSSYGAQAFTWLAILGVAFFVPYALLTA